MGYFSFYKVRIALAFLIAFVSVQAGYSQINSPSSGGVRICASLGSSEFTITSSFSSGIYTSNNIFSLELSDVDGSYTNSQILGTTGTDIGTSNIQFVVDFENFIEPFKGSDNYKLRITASEGGSDSQDLTIPIYYRDNTRLEADPDCLIGDGRISAIPSNLDSYIWRKDGLVIVGEISNFLDVNQVGEYTFSPDFGDCLATFGASGRSNIATVRPGAGSEISITNAPVGSVCSDEIVILNSSVTDMSFAYDWRKDGQILSDVISDSFTVSGSDGPSLTVSGIDMEGEYLVEFKESRANDDCADQSESITISLLNPKISITSPTTVLLLPPGEPKTLTAQVVRGENPVITWFKDDEPQPNSNSVNFEVTEPGIYTVMLEAESPCPEDNIVAAIEEVNVGAAEDLEITIDYRDPANYDDCELSEVVLDVTQIIATINGNTEILDESQLGLLEVDWQVNNVSTGETSESNVINSASDNGTYTAVIDLDGDDATENDKITSNALTVILALDSFEIFKSEPTLPLNGEIQLSLGLEDATGYTFQWFKNVTEEIANSNSEEITITEPGLYTVDVFFSTCGSVPVPGISVSTGSPVIPSVITPNGDGINDDWVLTGDLTLNEAVEVNIYASNGELDYSTTSYNGEWPEESTSKAIGTIYYYVISRDNNPIEQGSITIIR